MARFFFLISVMIGLTGCIVDNNRFDPGDTPLEGVLKDVRFNLGGETDNCMVEFTDGRVFCFNNGEGFLFWKGKINRIYRRGGGRLIDAVEIIGTPR